MSGQGQSSGGGCCSLAMFVVGGLFLLGLFTFDPLTMLVCGVIGAGLWVGAYFWHTTPSSSSPAMDERPDKGAPSIGVPDYPDLPKHRPARPRGEDFEPWNTPDRMQPIAGEFYQQDSYAQLARQLEIPWDGTRATIDLAADLGLDPENVYARHGVAITVWIEGVLVGFLPDGVVPEYLPILDRLDRDGKHVTVRARIYLSYDTSRKKWQPSTHLKLPDPNGILPANAMPHGKLEMVPSGRSIQVIGEENHMEYLAELVDPSGPSHYIATLRPTQMGIRTFYDTVQVLIDGREVGAFSRTMGEQTVSLVKLIGDAGRIPVARATVEGNSLRAEVKVRMQRAAEFDQDRVHELQAIARQRRANTNHRGEPFAWDDDDLLNGSPTQQDRDAEDGGA